MFLHSALRALSARRKSRKVVCRYRVHVMMPLLFFVGGGGFYTDSTIVSGLTEIPSVESIMVDKVSKSVLDVQKEDLSRTVADKEAEQCRWRNDRSLLSHIGDLDTDHASTYLASCPVNDEFSDTTSTSVDVGIRGTVELLATDEYPIQDMATAIAQYDAHIAGLIVGIAKKESNWGKRTPKLHGEECFNYWGYRGAGNRGLTGDGYGCFAKPDDAVVAIGDRLVELSQIRGTTDPARMVIWKCGSSCSTHSPESVAKWISDVDYYYRQFIEERG